MQRPALILMEKQFALNPVDSKPDEPSAWMVQTSLGLMPDLSDAVYVTSSSPPVRVSMLVSMSMKMRLLRARFRACIVAYNHRAHLPMRLLSISNNEKRDTYRK